MRDIRRGDVVVFHAGTARRDEPQRQRAARRIELPRQQVGADQLNGGEFVELTPEDWELILPYLQENERLFGISIEKDLLVVNGQKKTYAEVYRKVQAVRLEVLSKASVGMEEWGEDWEA